MYKHIACEHVVWRRFDAVMRRLPTAARTLSSRCRPGRRIVKSGEQE